MNKVLLRGGLYTATGLLIIGQGAGLLNIDLFTALAPAALAVIDSIIQAVGGKKDDGNKNNKPK